MRPSRQRFDLFRRLGIVGALSGESKWDRLRECTIPRLAAKGAAPGGDAGHRSLSIVFPGDAYHRGIVVWRVILSGGGSLWRAAGVEGLLSDLRTRFLQFPVQPKWIAVQYGIHDGPLLGAKRTPWISFDFLASGARKFGRLLVRCSYSSQVGGFGDYISAASLRQCGRNC